MPGFTGAHSQGKTLNELIKNLQEVISLLLKDRKIIKSSRIQPKNNVGKNVGIDYMLHIIFIKYNKLHYSFESGHRHHSYILAVP